MKDISAEKLKAFETGVITDSFSLLGINGWMTGIHPVDPMKRLCGKAFTILYEFVEEGSEKDSFNYYRLLNEIEEGDVIVLAAGGCPYANYGENMQHAAKKAGAAGVIVDGPNRDTPVIRDYDLPVFSRGSEIRIMPANFKITARNVPVECGGILVRPGDYLLGDADGVLCIPKERTEEVLYQAERIQEIEKEVENAIESGRTMDECVSIISRKKIKRV